MRMLNASIKCIAHRFPGYKINSAAEDVWLVVFDNSVVNNALKSTLYRVHFSGQFMEARKHANNLPNGVNYDTRYVWTRQTACCWIVEIFISYSKLDLKKTCNKKMHVGNVIQVEVYNTISAMTNAKMITCLSRAVTQHPAMFCEC